MKKINVLISAHEFSPKQGSECSVGWNIVMNLAQDKDLNLYVLHADGAQGYPNSYLDAINDYFVEHKMPNNLKLISVNQPKLSNLLFKSNLYFFKKIGSMGFPVIYYWSYNLWQRKAFKKAKKLLKLNEIDIAHNLTQISFREPGYLWKLDIPFVWGPIGGFTNLPSSVLKELPPKAKVLDVIRNLSNDYQFNIKRRVKHALKKADTLYLISEENKLKISKINSEIKILLDSSTSKDEKAFVRNFDSNEKLKIIWVGSLISRKSLNVLLYSLSKIENVNNLVDVTILGNGPNEDDYKKLSDSLSLNCVKFVGRVPHEAVKSYLLNSHVLVHTSYREATTVIIPEALSTGLPIICHDISGMAIAVTDSCGLKIPLVDNQTSISGFQKAIELLLNEPKLVTKLSEGAILRRDELTWEKSADKISSGYKKILHIKVA